MQASRYCCERGHSFDIARQGYVNLLPVQHKRSRAPGDSKEMVVARRAFLETGAYAPIAEAVAESVASQKGEGAPAILDAGCGEGYYLAAVRRRLGPGAKLIGVDISKAAILAAARKHDGVTWVVASNRQRLVADGSLDMVLSLFGFPCYQPFAAALKAGGALLQVDAGPDHLIELRRLIYPEVRHKPLPTLDAAEQAGFALEQSRALQYPVELDSPQAIQQLMLMTPHFFRAPRQKREAVARLESLSLTVDVALRLLRR